MIIKTFEIVVGTGFSMAFSVQHRTNGLCFGSETNSHSILMHFCLKNLGNVMKCKIFLMKFLKIRRSNL